MSEAAQRVAVIGAGTMGHGIAQVAAAAGCAVTLTDTTRALAEAGIARVRENLHGGVARGKVTAEERDAALARLAPSDSLADAVRTADIVVEAVPERIELKAAVFAEVERHARADAVLATNTSSLSVSDLQQRAATPARVIGLHFFNPVHINKLVEVVKGRETASETLESALAFVRRLGKEPVVVNDAPGFATSRLGVLLGLEAMRMVEEGVASTHDIDRAMELGYRHPMGPLKLTDLVGLDVRLDIAEYLHAKLGTEQFRPPRLLRDMVAQGKLGRKSGEGFYRWDDA
jgi:3-hydroxybutyryl-CoA dehydrogenase